MIKEPIEAGSAWRATLLEELDALIATRRHEADVFRAGRKTTTATVRADLVEALGWPLADYRPGAPSTAEETPVSDDPLGRLTRLRIDTLPGLRTYAMLWVPPGPGPHPLVIVQHGGQGTPELVLGLLGESASYNEIGQRLLERGLAVLVPQLTVSWGEAWGRLHDQPGLEHSLRHLGGSLAALEVVRLRRCLDFLAGRPEIDASRIGMAGLSYGGFFTLLTAALDERIRAAYCSCFFNDRYRYPWADMVWKGSAFRFLDAELAGAIAPRALYVDIGSKDEIFVPDDVAPHRRQLEEIYAAAGATKQLNFQVTKHGHEFDPGPAPIDFLERHLRAT